MATSCVGRKGLVVACDLLTFEPVEGAVILPARDFTSNQTQEEMVRLLGERRVNVVLSDMAPNVSGVPEMDHDGITDLVYHVVRFALLNSANNGALLVKMFNGRNLDKVVSDIQRYYKLVKQLKPSSSRRESSEIYILAKNFVGIKNRE